MINRIKESVGVTAGVTAPVWLQEFNVYVGAAIGVLTLVYAVLRIYYLVKDHK